MNNKTITTSDSDFNTSLVESSSTLEVNNDKRIVKSDDQNQPNHSNQLLLHNTNDNNLDNCETVCAKQMDSFRKCANNELRNFSTQRNDSQSSIPSCVNFRKPPETTTSIQKKLEPSKGFDSPSSYNRNQLSRNHCVRESHKATNHGQLEVSRINGKTVLQVHLDAPSGSHAIKPIPNTSSSYLDQLIQATNSSVDSGQGSTELSIQNCSFKDSFNCDKTIAENSLPSYARIANTIDHVLRVCTTFHAALNNEMNEKWNSDVICEAKVLIATIQSLPYITFLSAH
ncbi:hypothetical protein WUBG_14103, partial [Wuchereria bancrofti]